MTLYFETPGQVFVDSSKLRVVPVENLMETMETLKAIGKPIKYLPSIQSLSRKQIEKLLSPPSEQLEISLTSLGVSHSLIQAIYQAYDCIKAELEIAYKKIIIKYTISPWEDSLAHVAFYKSKLRRINKSRRHEISYKTAKEIYLYCYNYWLTEDKDEKSAALARWINRTGISVSVSGRSCDIGCQNISKGEMDAIAIHLGWINPTTGELLIKDE